MKTIKKLGEISNGSTITFQGKEIEISGIWQNTRMRLRDNTGAVIHGYFLIGKGGAFNGTLYDAVIAKDTKHPIFNLKNE